jgi:hypothetical protein
MSLRGKGVLAIWNGIAAEAEDAFLAWHVGEHIPERVSVPGFLRGRRYVALDGDPKYFNFYETQDTATLASPAYMARLNAPSPWTRQVVPHFTDTSRTVCRVVESLGQGDGGWIGTIRMDVPGGNPAFAAAMVEQAGKPALAQPGIIGVHLLEGEPKASTGATAEKAMRSQPDEVVGWILLVEGATPQAVQHVLATALGKERLMALGVTGAIRSGLYGLQYGLGLEDVA